MDPPCERWFAEITNKRIRRGIFRSVKGLEHAISEYIDIHGEDPKPFVWTRTADQILASIARYAQRTRPRFSLHDLLHEPLGQETSGSRVDDKWGLLEGDYADGRRLALFHDVQEVIAKKTPLQSVIREWLQTLEKN
jgi:hypothetical protein